jgi:hypothetical protein
MSGAHNMDPVGESFKDSISDSLDLYFHVLETKTESSLRFLPKEERRACFPSSALFPHQKLKCSVSSL